LAHINQQRLRLYSHHSRYSLSCVACHDPHAFLPSQYDGQGHHGSTFYPIHYAIDISGHVVAADHAFDVTYAVIVGEIVHTLWQIIYADYGGLIQGLGKLQEAGEQGPSGSYDLCSTAPFAVLFQQVFLIVLL